MKAFMAHGVLATFIILTVFGFVAVGNMDGGASGHGICIASLAYSLAFGTECPTGAVPGHTVSFDMAVYHAGAFIGFSNVTIVGFIVALALAAFSVMMYVVAGVVPDGGEQKQRQERYRKRKEFIRLSAAPFLAWLALLEQRNPSVA